MASWIAAATSYSSSNVPMIPFYIFYSMFGFQRVGDLAWAAGDMRSRGFLIGGTSGRTTLNGEGLQHQDGHSHILSSTIPNCISYDPTFGYELATIIRHGLRTHLCRAGRCLLLHYRAERELRASGFASRRRGRHHQRHIPSQSGRPDDKAPKVQLLGTGAILSEVVAGADLLEEISESPRTSGASRASPSSPARPRRSSAGMSHPEEPPRVPYSRHATRGVGDGPHIASTDYVKLFAEQIAPYLRFGPITLSAPTVSGARTSAAGFGATSRSTAILWPSRR